MHLQVLSFKSRVLSGLCLFLDHASGFPPTCKAEAQSEDLSRNYTHILNVILSVAPSLSGFFSKSQSSLMTKNSALCHLLLQKIWFSIDIAVVTGEGQDLSRKTNVFQLNLLSMTCLHFLFLVNFRCLKKIKAHTFIYIYNT